MDQYRGAPGPCVRYSTIFFFCVALVGGYCFALGSVGGAHSNESRAVNQGFKNKIGLVFMVFKKTDLILF
jgi:hypothetical protein